MGEPSQVSHPNHRGCFKEVIYDKLTRGAATIIIPCLQQLTETKKISKFSLFTVTDTVQLVKLSLPHRY